MSSIVVLAVFVFGVCELAWACYVQRQAARVRANAMLDPLTGLFNRRGWEELASRETARARRDGSILTVFYMDVDDFKRINDESGHAAGDVVLRDLARVIRAAAREEDVVARLGGDEFAVLTADGGDAAMRQRLLDRWTDAFRPLGVSVSIGVATVRDGEDTVSVVQRADESMYEQKRFHRTAPALRTAGAGGAPSAHSPRS